MKNMAFRVGVVMAAALLTGSAMGEDGRQASADNAMPQLENATRGETFDGGQGQRDAYPNGGDDGSVVNPDPGDDSAEAPDNDGSDDQDSGGDDSGDDDQGPPPTIPA